MLLAVCVCADFYEILPKDPKTGSLKLLSATSRSGTAISGTRFFGSLDFPTRRFARTLKNTRQSKQIKTHPSTTDLQAITTNRLGNFCRLALQEASILMDTPKGHIFSPPRPPKRAEATAFSPSRHEKETSNETPEHPRYRENKDNNDEEDNQGVPPASSDLTSPRVLKYRREYNEEDGFAAEQAQARKYLHHDILRADFRGTATVSSHSDEDDSFSEMSIATADAKPSGERRKLAWEDEIDISESVQGQGPNRSGDTTLIPCVKRMPSALPSPPS